jgi:hypothetical protein
MTSVEQNKVKRSGVGLRACDRDRAFAGFTLFAPLGGNGTVYLIDLDGKVVHTWQMPYPPGMYGISPIAARFFITGKQLITRRATSTVNQGKAVRHWKLTGTVAYFGRCAIQTITTTE